MYKTFYSFTICNDSAQTFTVKLQRYSDEPLSIGFYLGELDHLISNYFLDTFLLLDRGVLLQSNTKEPDFQLSKNLVKWTQCSIIKHLSNHAQLNEA